MTYICKMSSPIGLLYIASDGDSITGLWIEGQKYFEATIKGEVVEKKLPIFDMVKKWLEIYFQGENPDFELPLSLIGSEFRKEVWKVLLTISYGETMTYGDIARKLSKKSIKASAQAVGGAVGHNPISIIIPCHRVVGSDGSLIGYAGGISNKVKLLELEKVPMDNLYIPMSGTAL